MNNKYLFIITILCLIGAGYIFVRQTQKVVVTSFDECVSAGNQIMESYPRQCRHNEVLYVEELSEQVIDSPTSADNAPPGSLHNLPVPQAVAAVKSHVAQRESVNEGLVIVLTAYEKEWSDSCLGLGGPAESCLFAATPGYDVTLQVKGVEQKYRTNTDGSEIRREK